MFVKPRIIINYTGFDKHFFFRFCLR